MAFASVMSAFVLANSATIPVASAHHWWAPWTYQNTDYLSVADRTTPFPVDDRTWKWDSGLTSLHLTYRWWDCSSPHGCIMVWDDYNLPSGTYGITEMQRYADGSLRGANVRMNPNTAVTAAQRSKTTCHELGHALTLGHHPDMNYTASCMRSGAAPPISNNPDWHDYQEINTHN